MKRHLTALFLVAAVSCGESKTGPTSALASLPTGPYVLRVIGAAANCVPAPGSPPGLLFSLAMAPVTLSRDGTDWVARASGSGGDAEVRFHETAATAGGAMIEGVFRGTLATAPETGLSTDTRAAFGDDGSARLTGRALVGPFGTSNIGGEARGAITFTDGSGRACTTPVADWALLSAR